MSDSADLLSPAAEPAWPHAAVLIVDDEQGMRHFLSRALAPRFGRVDAVDSAEAGRDLVAAHRYDLVILDMIMPDMSGGDVFDRLREINPQVMVLLASGYSIDGRAMDILNRGCNGFIQKPFGMEDLTDKISSILKD